MSQTMNGMSMEEYEDYLKSFDEAFTAAPVPERGNYSAVPDGRYQVFIDKAEIRTNTNTGGMELSVQLKILGGEYQNRIIFHRRELDNPDRMSYLRGDLEVLGMGDVQRISQLPSQLKRMLDVKLEVQVKHKPNPNNPERPYVNVYLNKRLEERGDTQDDDRPF